MVPNLYPDPDFVPSFPWLGQREDEDNIDDDIPSVDVEASKDNASLESPQNDLTSDMDYQSSELSSTDEDIETNQSEAEEKQISTVPRTRRRTSLDQEHEDWETQNRRPRGRPRGKGRVPKGTKRGLVRPLEPDLEFKQALALANEAFIGRRLDEAQEHALEAIRLNPEIFQAHILLSEIYTELGDEELSLRALFNGAHTRSRDVQIWFTVKDRLFPSTGESHTPRSKEGILYCLNRILALQPDNLDCRVERTAMNKDLGFYYKASQDLHFLLQERQNDLVLLRQYAEVSMKTGEIDFALKRYEEAVACFLNAFPAVEFSLEWSDVNVLIELYAADKKYDIAIDKLKFLSRWMLGRGADETWSSVNDDREWDFDDEPRRSKTLGFEPGLFSRESYGQGLPLELRVKLGAYRLKLDSSDHQESLLHFEWLDPDNSTGEAKVHDYPDLFHDVAEVLLSHNLHKEALRYFSPLLSTEEPLDAAVLDDMATCYRYLDMRREAEDCYLKIIEMGQRSQLARVQLMSMGEDDGSSQRIQSLIRTLAADPAVNLNRFENARLLMKSDAETLAQGYGVLKPTVRREHIDRVASRLKEVQQQEYEEEMHRKFILLQNLTQAARESSLEARSKWLTLADELIQDFASHKPFYPADRFYMGSVMAGRIHASQSDPSVLGKEVPEVYHGIEYSSWLDIILEASIFQAQRGYHEKAYETVMVALDAIVYAVSSPSLLLIHICWFTCAILAKDHEALCSISRWFMKEYQFISDGYRLFGALNRVCAHENSWYNSGPSQKHILRQLKAMDTSLRFRSPNGQVANDVATCSTKDADGSPIKAEQFNVALLMLYGHILYAGKSYTEALNYYFRAYAVENENAVLNLSIGLAYLHHAFKRQSDNRHHLILQGFSFLYNYYQARQDAQSPSLKQEADYNMGRAYHIIGLAHLAIPFYEQCLTSQNQRGIDSLSRQFRREAALALQNLWAASGGTQKAKIITDRWLVL